MAISEKRNYGDTKSLVNIEAVEQNTVILVNGDLRQVIMIGGINLALKSPEEQDILIATYQNFLNSLEYSVQIIIHSRKINIENYLKTLAGYETNEPSALLKNQISEYREFVRAFVEKNAIMQKTFFMVVPYTSIAAAMKQGGVSFIASLNPFGGKEVKKTDEKKDSAQKDIENTPLNAANAEERTRSVMQLLERTTQIIDGLFSIGLDAVQLNDEQLVELFYNFYNPESTEKKAVTVPKE